jgi:ABC-type Mn2+/Zn2+ transport system permease subunit
MRIGLIPIMLGRRADAHLPVLEPFQLPFVQRALVEVVLLAAVAGSLGCWIVLRGLAFPTHGVAAATFPGLVLADGLGFSAPLGAFGAGLLFALAVGRLSVGSRDDGHDTLTALVLVAALATGIVLASDVFHSAAQVETLLFGSLLAIGPGDVRLAGAVALVAVAASLLLGRRWLAVGFDRGAARGLGLRSAVAELALLVLLALAAVATLSAVGALLASALLVVPAATTRLLTRRMGSWQLATVALAAGEGVAGLWLAVKLNAPPGATIAVVAGALFACAAGARTIRPARPAHPTRGLRPAREVP